MKKCYLLLPLLLICLKLGATPDNIAPLAKVKASSAMEGAEAVFVTDGKIGVENRFEWASTSSVAHWGGITYPWIQLTWDREYAVNRVILYDRATPDSHTAGGILHFSDGSSIYVYAIPNNGTAKVVDFPSKKVTWIKFEVMDGDGFRLGLSEIEVYPAFEDCADFVSQVNPYIETTRGRYDYFISGARPFGMIGAAPLTRNKHQWGGGYNYNSTEVIGFPQTHCWMVAGITLMPATSGVNPSLGEKNWKSVFSHDGEIVQPAYHRLFLNDWGVWTEQTVTDRVSFYRLRYTRDTIANILLNCGGHTSACAMNDARIRKVSNTELEISVNTTGRRWGGPKNVRIYFIVQFEKPFERLDGWDETKIMRDIDTLSGPNIVKHNRDKGYDVYYSPTTGACAVYKVKAGDEILVKFALSYTSIENARRNLNAECRGWDFDAVRAEARAKWNDWLGRIEVKGGSEAQRMKFYTDLWHVLVGRPIIDDVSGDYPDYTGETNGTGGKYQVRTLPKDANGKAIFHIHDSDSFWLTQWNLNILWGLAWPEVVDDMSACMVQYAENGGLLPRGPSAGGYTDIMTACPVTPLIVSAYQKGYLTKKTPEAAYEAMKRNHEPGGMMFRGVDGAFYKQHGYITGNHGAGITLEAAFQDWALGQMAARMGKTDDYEYYMKRSESWKKLFEPTKKLIFPKDDKGEWLHTDPLSGRGWVEANSWQATWSVSHDIPALAALMGGNETLCSMLDSAFIKQAPKDFLAGYGAGYISYANQPGCSDAHVFSHAGKPWLTQYWVRRVKEQTYGAVTPDKGYGNHDEDQGQMGGVSALMAIGLFNIQGTCSQTPLYDVTSPIFDEVKIRLNPDYCSGKEFIIKTYNNSAENCYIQKARLNGKIHTSFQFPHEVFAKGGTLELWLGPKPDKKWGK